MAKPYKTHYQEKGKPICGTSSAMFVVSSTEAWYAASNKCEKCRSEIRKRTIFI